MKPLKKMSTIITFTLIFLFFTSNSFVYARPVLKKVYKAPTIVIDPGHGGRDPGTCKGNFYEKDVNLDIARKLRSMLKARGYNVIMTRNSDVSLENLYRSVGTIQQRNLFSRAKIIDNSGAKFFISLHVNSCKYNSRINGSVVYYYRYSNASKKLADKIQSYLDKDTIKAFGRSKMAAGEGEYYILRNTKSIGVLVETGFITNKNDRYLLTTQKFRNRIASSISAAVTDYLN